MDTPLDVQEMVAIVYCMDVTMDTILLVTVQEHVLLVVTGVEVLQFVREVHEYCLLVFYYIYILYVLYFIIYVTLTVHLFTIHCITGCTCPPRPSNGYTTGCYITDSVGSSVYYYCYHGYLVGNNTRTCTSSGNWTGSAPVCRGM